jgi:NADP-dependent 3-hydroxy acid dehydrogenase YdfG
MADDGKVFLITGASTGIGAATARRAADAGYRLVLAARSRDRLESLAEELGGAGRALAVGCDVMDWGEQERLAAAALEAFGRIDAVFANAGFGARRGFLEESPEHWRDMVLTNVLGPAVLINAALPALRESRGRIVLVGSVAGFAHTPGNIYGATKWVVTGMAENTRLMVTAEGIGVTLIAPGRVETPFWDNRSEGLPGGHLLTPDQLADTIAWVINQPPGVDINTVIVRPIGQPV